MTDRLVIEVRINEYTMREANPHVPYSPEEIATPGEVRTLLGV